MRAFCIITGFVAVVGCHEVKPGPGGGGPGVAQDTDADTDGEALDTDLDADLPPPSPGGFCAAAGMSLDGTFIHYGCLAPAEIGVGVQSTDGTLTLQSGPIVRLTP